MNELVIVGKTVSTHGIKGELKVISDFEYADRVYVVGNKILINNIEHTISSIRYHKNYILLGIDNLNNINNVLEFVGYNIYYKKIDLNLDSNEYLLSDLVGMEVYDNNVLLGTVKEVVLGAANNFIRVNNTKEFLIPIIPEYIIKIDKDNKKVLTKDANNLIV